MYNFNKIKLRYNDLHINNILCKIKLYYEIIYYELLCINNKTDNYNIPNRHESSFGFLSFILTSSIYIRIPTS